MKLKSRGEIASVLLERHGTDYLFIGSSFRQTTTNESCKIGILDRPTPRLNEKGIASSKELTHIQDTSLELSGQWQRTNFLNNGKLDVVKAIELAGQDKISRATLEKIGYCQQIVYLISNNVGYSACLKMARFAQVFLNIGGIAVNVESAGIAHEADCWLERYDSTDVFDIYSLYVGLVETEDFYYSCGMHNFGKADVALEISEDVNLAIYVMNVFNYYRLTEYPILQDGHTFKPDIESPSYRIKLIEDSDRDSPLFNLYGVWHLERC